MPRNNRAIEREERFDQLLDAAEHEFMSVGYAKTTMAQIARLADVTGPNLYWYFSSKDGALAAVHRRVLARTRERLPAPTPGNAMARLEDYLEITRAEARPLHQMLHERAPYSADVADTLTDIHDDLGSLIRGAVFERSPDFPDTEVVVSLAMATIEGTNATRSPDHSSFLVRFAIERLVPAT